VTDDLAESKGGVVRISDGAKQPATTAASAVPEQPQLLASEPVQQVAASSATSLNLIILSSGSMVGGQPVVGLRSVSDRIRQVSREADFACISDSCVYDGCGEGCDNYSSGRVSCDSSVPDWSSLCCRKSSLLSEAKCCFCGWWSGQRRQYFARNRRTCDAMFGWMIPSGCCGQGCPPAGCYSLVYATDPQYFDSRDGGLYAAQGYGAPVTVPLAPNVHYSFNYGWGTPSSRITPISHPLPSTRSRPAHW